MKNKDIMSAVLGINEILHPDRKLEVLKRLSSTNSQNKLDNDALIQKFEEEIEQIDSFEAIFRYRLSYLEQKGVIVHFSFDNNSKFFDM